MLPAPAKSAYYPDRLLEVLEHLLVASELSGRKALPDHALICSLSQKRILTDEAELSDVTGKPVARPLLKTCAVAEKRGEPEHFGRCEFSGIDVLRTELCTSEISGKPYRRDQKLRSAVSGQSGHKDEFLYCHETRQPITAKEVEQCQVTGKFVRPGILERCHVTGKAVLPSELERCAVTDRRVLKKLLVVSSVSGARLQHQLAILSISGKYCAPSEARGCIWSGRISHPDDLRACSLTGVSFHTQLMSPGANPFLQPLGDLLHGICHTADGTDRWDEIASKASIALGGSRCRIEAGSASPDKRHLALCLEVRTLLGLRVQQAGLLYSIVDRSIVGRFAIGKRTAKGWVGVTG